MNNYFEFLDKLSTLNRLMRRGYTGPPEQLAKRLSVSQRTLHRIIDGLKTRGVEIKYCRVRCSYRCDGNNTITDILFKIDGFSEMSKEQMVNISGGYKLFFSKNLKLLINI